MHFVVCLPSAVFIALMPEGLNKCQKQISQINLKGTGHYLSPGGGGRGWTPEDLELNKVKFSLSPFECYLTEIIPPNNIWWLSRFPPTPCGLPFESFQRFWWSPFLGSQLRLIPPFVLHKIKCPPPPPQEINNDRVWESQLTSAAWLFTSVAEDLNSRTNPAGC